MSLNSKTKCVDMNDVSLLFSKREKNTHKGSYGELLCICGSYNEYGGMCGAAYLSAISAYRCGAGIVRIYTHKNNYTQLSSLVPECVFNFYDSFDKNEEKELIKLIERADCVLIGCGLSLDERARKILHTTLEYANKYLVIDADALNIMSNEKSIFKNAKAKTVITPHIGEMSRLINEPVSYISKNKEKCAFEFANKYDIVCVLKDAESLIAGKAHLYLNKSGCPAMAKGGSGDVLAGMIAGTLTQKHISEKYDLSYICACVVFLHGRAGCMAAEKYGEYSLLARNISEYIGYALTEKDTK